MKLKQQLCIKLYSHIYEMRINMLLELA